MKNYYEELEVSRNASDEVISRAYKVLAKKYHPDTTTENKQIAEERFKRISEAYEVLSNEQKRAEYDKTLQPEVTADRFNRILEDNKKLSRELLNLKSQLDNINTNRTTYTTRSTNTPPPNSSYNYNNVNQNPNYNQANYSQPNYNQTNYNQTNNYYGPRQNTYRKQYSLLDEIKYKLRELGRKAFAIIITITIMILAFGILYLIPPTRKFIFYDLQLGAIFNLFN